MGFAFFLWEFLSGGSGPPPTNAILITGILGSPRSMGGFLVGGSPGVV